MIQLTDWTKVTDFLNASFAYGKKKINENVQAFLKCLLEVAGFISAILKLLFNFQYWFLSNKMLFACLQRTSKRLSSQKYCYPLKWKEK